jgi:DNA polymerase
MIDVPTVFIDFETYYDKEYSLRKLQTDEYILDERYETIMVNVWVDQRGHMIHGTEQEVHDKLHDLLDWSQYAVCAHNNMFDGFIMARRFNINPRLWKCTLKLGRMLLPYLPSHSLAALSKHFGFDAKGTEVHNMLGKRRADMTESEFSAYAAYCIKDTQLCQKIHDELIPRTPLLNLLLIDMTIRMFTEPGFVGDVDLMQELYEKEVARKEGLLALANADKSVIMSNNKFAERLRELGVIPPTKISPRTGKTTFAFAKTDKEFMNLLEHPDSEVQALVAARTGAKTTIAETRAERFVQMAKRGPLPVYLNYWGAKTTGRYSGGNKVNWQNLPARGVSAGLRNALKAPPGYKVIVGDSSNIELRMVMALAGEHEAIKKLDAGVDMYCDFASSIFGREITKEDKVERFLGKTAMLGLQYGAGAPRFADMANMQGKGLGVEVSLDKAYEVVDLYRSLYSNITQLWRRCENVILPDIANGCDHLPVDVNGWFITQLEGFGRPGEPGVVYHNLRYDTDNDGWIYDQGRSIGKSIYGAKVVENLCQHAAMHVVMWQTAKIHQRYPVKLSVHDEAVCLAPVEEAEEAKNYLETCLSIPPEWCRGKLPVVGEVEIGDSYGDAK